MAQMGYAPPCESSAPVFGCLDCFSTIRRQVIPFGLGERDTAHGAGMAVFLAVEIESRPKKRYISIRCGGRRLHQYLKTQPLSAGFFSARSASVGAVPGVCLFSAAPPTVPVSGPFGPVFSLCSLSGSLPKNAPHPAKTRACARRVAFFVCWRRRDREGNRRKKTARRRCVVEVLAISFWIGSSCAAAASPAAGCRCGSDAPARSRCRGSSRPRRRPELDAPAAQSCWPAPG